jgi:ABC-type multidrug transport system fused ATPase/permease subunit
VATGTHQELMENNEFYRALVAGQTIAAPEMNPSEMC